VPGEFYEFRVLAIDCNNGETGAAPVSPVIEFPLSSEAFYKKTDFKFYPNPAYDYLNFVSILTNSEVQISDLAGKILSGSSFLSQDNPIKIAHLSPGIFLVSVKSGTSTKTQKFIKN